MSLSTVVKAAAAVIAVSLVARHMMSVSHANQLPQTINHYVRVRSSVPAMAGQMAQIYVRERAMAGTIEAASSPDRKVVLFVHGAGTPAEVAFDAPFSDHSWMAHLANAGHDVFAMDHTGYGRSTRPTVMNDPCNLSNSQQAALILIAWSLGAPRSGGFTAKHPDKVQSLVILAPAGAP